MQIKPMCPEYAVSEQITVADVTAIAQAGFKSILCNRPDGEIGPDDQMAAIASAADQAGLVFADNPFDHATFGADVIARQSDLLASLPAPVLA
ncbi:MAG: sulfur transferase domain-containing protein, partial [Pseudomonadota bacterium]